MRSRTETVSLNESSRNKYFRKVRTIIKEKVLKMTLNLQTTFNYSFPPQ